MPSKKTNTHIYFFVEPNLVLTFKLEKVFNLDGLLENCEVYEIANVEEFNSFEHEGRECSNNGFFMDESTLIGIYNILAEAW